MGIFKPTIIQNKYITKKNIYINFTKDYKFLLNKNIECIIQSYYGMNIYGILKKYSNSCYNLIAQIE